MHKKPRLKPRLVSLDLTKPEVSALRGHPLAGHGPGRPGDPGMKIILARIVSRPRAEDPAAQGPLTT